MEETIDNDFPILKRITNVNIVDILIFAIRNYDVQGLNVELMGQFPISLPLADEVADLAIAQAQKLEQVHRVQALNLLGTLETCLKETLTQVSFEAALRYMADPSSLNLENFLELKGYTAWEDGVRHIDPMTETIAHISVEISTEFRAELYNRVAGMVANLA